MGRKWGGGVLKEAIQPISLDLTSVLSFDKSVWTHVGGPAWDFVSVLCV